MGVLDRLKAALGGKTPVSPEDLPMLVVDLATGHAQKLRDHVPVDDPPAWDQVLDELLRAHFSLASLWLGTVIREDGRLNSYGARLLAALRTQPGSGAVQRAFGDERALDYAIRIYVQGRAGREDSEAADDCAALLRLSRQNALLMLCGYVQIRTMRLLGVSKQDPAFLAGWIVNGTMPVGIFKEVLGKLKPVGV